MEQLHLTTYSVALLNQIILALVITLYLLRIGAKTRATWWLTAFCIAFGLVSFCQWFLVSVLVAWQPYFTPAPYLSTLLLLTVGIQFAYEFLGNPYRREAQAVLILTALAVVGLTGYVITQYVTIGPENPPLQLIATLLLLLSLWTMIVFLRKSWHFSTAGSEGKHFEGEAIRHGRFVAALRVLFRPVNKEARAHTAYAQLMGVLAGLTMLVAYLLNTGVVTPRVNNFVGPIGQIVFLTGFVILYINYSQRPVSFQVKLVGLFLATMLAIMGSVSFELYSEEELIEAGAVYLTPEHETIRFVPDGSQGYQVATLPVHFDAEVGTALHLDDGAPVSVALGFPFAFYDRVWNEVYVNKDGLVTFGGPYPLVERVPGFLPIEKNPDFYNEQPKIAVLLADLDPSEGGVFGKLEPDKATFTWQAMPQRDTGRINTVQLVLHRDGTIDLTYEKVEAQVGYYRPYGLRGLHPGGSQAKVSLVSSDEALPRVLEAGTALVEDYRLQFRQFIHGKVARLVYLVVGATLFILLVFPVFFRTSLVRPLNTLLEGVNQVNAGRFDVEVPIRVYDEIGALSDHFNRMAGSLKKADQELRAYARDLEQRVAARTRDLQEKNGELEQAISDLRAAQAQLVQAEKMASLGQLTAGIAHEIKNPLNFVNNFADMSIDLADDLLEELQRHKDKLGDAVSDDFEAILADIKVTAGHINKHGRRANSIVSSMMEHSRNTPGKREPTALNALLDEYLNLAYHSMQANRDGFHIQIERTYDAAVGQVVVVPQEISRVFLNLLDNAFYAVYEKHCTQGRGFVPTVWVNTRRLDDTVEIRVRDNGLGISEAVREKVFEPFFTTKPTGAGNTGLGLSLSYDIVVQGHGGRLALESTKGEFAEFIVSLPAAPVSVPEAR